MRLAVRTVRLIVAAALAAAALPGCHRDPAAPSLAAASADAYVGRWIVEDPVRAPLPLGLTLARTGAGIAGRATYSGVAYDVTGTVGRDGLTLRPTDGGYTRLHLTLRRDGRLAVRLENANPAAFAGSLDLVLERAG
jgi:hypothetical protein